MTTETVQEIGPIAPNPTALNPGWLPFCIAAFLQFSIVACGDDDAPPVCEGEVGSAQCACQMDGSCDAGLMCAENICVAATVTGLQLPAGARGCDILVSSPGSLEAAFATSVEGTVVQEAPLVAISLVTREDSDFASDALSVTSTASFEIQSSACVDAQGAPVSGEVMQ